MSEADQLAAELALYRASVLDYAAAFARILKLHTPKHGRPITCTQCAKAWPCPTTKAALQPHQPGPQEVGAPHDSATHAPLGRA